MSDPPGDDRSGGIRPAKEPERTRSKTRRGGRFAPSGEAAPEREEKREGPGPALPDENPSPAEEPVPRAAPRPSHLERIAAVLPPEHREQWAVLASRHRAACSDNNDEFFLLAELIAFSGLIAREAFERQQAFSRQLEGFTSTATADVTAAIRRFHTEVELTSKTLVHERLEEMRSAVAENLRETIALPDIRDFKEMGDRLTRDLDMLRAVIDKLTAKAGAASPAPNTTPAAPPAPAAASSPGGTAVDLTGIKRVLLLCAFLVLAGAGGLGFRIWHETGKARADITSRVSEHELSYELAGTGGGLQLRNAVSARTKEDVRELVIDGGFLKVKDAFVTPEGKGVIHLDPRMTPVRKSVFSP